jgi:WD40 repeat protein
MKSWGAPISLTVLVLVAAAILTGAQPGYVSPFLNQSETTFPIGVSGPGPRGSECSADLFYKLLAQHSHSPLTVSPDGTMILFRVLGQNLHFGLAIEATKGSHVLHSLRLEGEVLHPAWSHNSQYVAFFLQDGTHRLRSLYLWNLHTDTVISVAEAVSYAVLHMDWSPDDRYIAYWEAFRGMYLVNIERRAIAKVGLRVGF